MKRKRGLLGRIDPRTSRPDSAYPAGERDPERYTTEFSRALGLKPARTAFGRKVVKL